MKNVLLITTIIILSLVGVYALNQRAKPSLSQIALSTATTNSPVTPGVNRRQAILKIEGMFCASCATSAEYALKEKPGIIDAAVDYDRGSGVVVYDPSRISLDEIVQAVKPYTTVITEDTPLQ